MQESRGNQGIQKESEGSKSHLAYRVPSSTSEPKIPTKPRGFPKFHPDPTAPFLRDFIPSEEEHPELHKSLTQKWYERQEAVRGLGDALGDDDADRYDTLKVMIDHINTAMHDEWKSVYGGNYQEGDGSAGLSPDHCVAHYCDVDDLPLAEPVKEPRSDSDESDGESEEERYLEADAGMETCKDTDWNTGTQKRSSGPLLKASFKQINTGVFTVKLSYQGVTSSRIVNDNMPLKSLFIMAISYLQTDFSFIVEDIEDIDLEYQNLILPRFGALASVPILVGAIIVIRYPISMPTDSRSPVPVPTRDHSEARSADLRVQDQDSQRLTNSPFPRSTPVPNPSRNEGLSPERVSEDLFHEFQSSRSPMDPRSYDRIRQSFKCPKFSGQAKEWKQWEKGFLRYLSIWELEYVLDPSFFDQLPLTPDKRRDNKLVYFVIEEAVQGSTLAASYVRQVPLYNGFEAYYTLHDGYVFAGATTAAILLNELSNFRFLPNETPTELCLRLAELFQELKNLPGDAAVTFIDTQQIGYLLNALRHEKEWETVCSAITTKQIEGNITFQQACDQLKF
jgi:hypothetical protein